ncbi:hypothetical protein [Stenotrophomonas maltophilia]|uniref:hypothetical protein n=1 Tax=Stenotrophomonas maltophilia TaxID=40324 RepID=UPI001F52E709|nr:hypothetical protein [Stenotrophomonas maltophilia]MCI1058782.1 hypothetical protein [Stenotrophomonas maltophilia]MCI1062249.1 hypothetical protein [Stenotrophomonas maltophilia]MCI1079788.1 hypothetical protein [Stenotrophomonas maltophilia]MCI1082937.1 hypothetical protein [Stenotrophomonas maltophilia]MCI1095260.1 hypothetical protein [Stenotrophomonas maltophilia]
MSRLSASLLIPAITLMLGGCTSELDKVRGQFIDSCMSSGAPKSNCKCAIDKLQDHYGEQGLVAINKQGRPPSDFFDQLANAAEQCRHQ